MNHADLIKAFGAFFAIMNPFINLPIFLAMTNGYTVGEQRILSIKIVISSAIMCAIILFAGQKIIGFFGITIDQFRIAGGIVLAHIAWSMLNGTNIATHHGSTGEKKSMKELSSIAFYPITFPMIVGPGTIATIIIYTGHASHFSGVLSVGAILAAILILLFIVLFFAANIGKLLSDTMRVITTRLMGMILLAISIAMIVAGIQSIFPHLTQ